ncbi:hypothetical protein Bpfe_001311, partial [Biomphalaria pfeifferi]
NSLKMSCKKKTQTGRNVSTDLADLSSLGDENQDTNCGDPSLLQDTCGLNDPHPFTSDQSKVQSDEVEGSLIGDLETQESEGGEADLHKYFVGSVSQISKAVSKNEAVSQISKAVSKN